MTLTEMGLPRTLSWGDFAQLQPEMAQFGARKLTEAPAYMATIRRSRSPRVHPVTPIISPLGLFLFMEPTSPKRRDLLERGWFALHNGVPDNAGSGGEFWISGRGFAVDVPAMWGHVADAASLHAGRSLRAIRVASKRGPLPRVRRRAYAYDAKVVGRPMSAHRATANRVTVPRALSRSHVLG